MDREWEGAGSFRRRAGTLSLACLQAAWLCLADLEGDHCPLLRNRIPGMRSHHTGKKNIRAPGTNALLKRTRDSSPSPACLHGAVARERKSGGRRPRHHLRGAPRPAHWVQEGVNGHLGKVSHFQKPQLSFYGFHNKF